MNLNQEFHYFRDYLQKNADPEHAKGSKNYLKSPYKHYGETKTPEKRKLVKSWVKAHKDLSIKEIEKLAKKLWSSQWYEEKTLAIMLLQYRKKDLTLENLPFVEKMASEATGWAYLDEISLRLISPLLDLPDPLPKDKLRDWSKSDNYWVRRSSLLCQIPQFRRGEGDIDLFFDLATPMFQEGESLGKRERFFIRKAIGWVLREMTKKSPDSVYKFVKVNVNEMSGLTFREATRKLPQKKQKELKKLRN